MNHAPSLIVGAILLLGAARAGAQSTNAPAPITDEMIGKKPSVWENLKGLQFRPLPDIEKLNRKLAPPMPEFDPEVFRRLAQPPPTEPKNPDDDWLVKSVEARIKLKEQEASATTPAAEKAVEELDYKRKVDDSLGWKPPVTDVPWLTEANTEEPDANSAPAGKKKADDAKVTDKKKGQPLSLFSEYTTKGIDALNDSKSAKPVKKNEQDEEDKNDMGLYPFDPPKAKPFSQIPGADTMSELTEIKYDEAINGTDSLESLGRPNKNNAFTELVTVNGSTNAEVLERQRLALLPPQPAKPVDPDSLLPPTLPLPGVEIHKEIYKPPSPFPKPGMYKSRIPDPSEPSKLQ